MYMMYNLNLNQIFCRAASTMVRVSLHVRKDVTDEDTASHNNPQPRRIWQRPISGTRIQVMCSMYLGMIAA